jgi:hypothetical protein
MLAVLDEELLIGVQRRTPAEDPQHEVAPLPDPTSISH